MRTVSQVVEEILDRSPFLAETIAEGVANNAQIARKIKKEVEGHLLEEVSEASIGMALHRLSKKSRHLPFGTRFLKQMHDIAVRSNLVGYVFSNTDNFSVLAENALAAIRNRRDGFLNFSRGLHESLLIINKDIEKEIITDLKQKKYIRRMENISAITMRLPESSLSIPGVYYPVLKALALEGISFVEVMSVNTELSVLFEDKDIERAFSIIKKLTSRGS